MKLNLQKFALVVAALLVLAVPAFAQHYPEPVSSNQSPALCNGCIGNNSFGKPNDKLKTWSYSDPLVEHVGRAVDSTSTDDYQDRGGGTGFRTARAGKMLVAREQRGAAPPRVYLQLGPAIGAYSLDKFFSTTLPAGPVALQNLVPWGRNDRSPSEKVAKWDAFIHPEAEGSGWTTPIFDGQDRMFDFDVDDRGFVYAATGGFGWGILRDTGSTGLMPLVKQLLTDDPSGVTPSIVISLKVEGRYYAVTSNNTDPGPGRAVFDVNTPSSPTLHRTARGGANAILAWAKNDATRKIAIVTGESKIAIYDYAAFVNGHAPLTTFTARSGFSYADVTADESGNFWTGEYTNKSPGTSNLIRFSPTGSTFTSDSFSVGAGGFSTNKINYSDKYIVAVGLGSKNGLAIELRLFKMENDQPVQVDLGEFFTYYYHRVPSADYAQPPQSTTSTIAGGHVVKANGKTYLVYNIDGLSDVYELQAGDSVSGTLKSGTAGTPNPNSRPTETGPFYADPLRFVSKSSNPSFEYSVEWDFDNPEAGSDNVVSSRTPQEVVHQYTGLSTSSKVTSTKSVIVAVPGNPDMSDTVQVSMTLPQARVGISGTSTILDADGKTIDVVLGDEFMDASDGTIQGHYAAWTIDGATTNLLPNEKISVGGFGAHTAAMAAKYGKYDNFTTVGMPYVDTIADITYTVRPFVAAFAPASIAGTQVTFKANARTGSMTNIPSWNVAWTLKTPGGADVVPPQSGAATFGTITPFAVADRGAIPSGSILTLTVSVDPTLLDASAANVASQTISQTLLTPDPKITRSGCANTGAPCSFTLTSVAGNSMDAWDIVWTLKRDGNNVGSSFSNPYTPSITAPGNYTISVVAKTDLFEGTATLASWNAAGPICNDPPTSSQLAIYTSCDNCLVNTNVTIKPDAFGYTWQDCEEYIWNFGDGSTLTTTNFETSHKYTSTGKKTIKLKVKKGTQTSPEVSYTITITSNGGEEPPPPTCSIPSNIQVSYAGNKGCGPNVACKTGEQVTFTARRLSSGLLACDNVTWTFHDNTTSTERSPRKTYSSPNSYTVTAAVSNNLGNATPVSVTVQVVQDNGGGNCAAPPTASQAYIAFRGRTSGCNDGSTNPVCRANEIIEFSPGAFLGYTFQSCDRFEWDFGDGTAKSAEMDATHTYANPAASYRVKLRVYNTINSTGTTFQADVPFSTAPVKPTPVLSFAGFPSTGSKGNAVTFVVNSNIPATGWAWDFGDGKKDTQPTHVGTSSTITHVYANTGTFTVTVKARNADDVPQAPTNSATGQIVVDEIPEFRYLLPVTAHTSGQNGSSWRTDVQIYNPDPNVSVDNALDMTAQFNGTTTQLHMVQSTYIYEDFLKTLTTADSASGPVIITTKAKYAPQIWTRTYTHTANGTFGQFIPAIRLDAAGGGSAVGEGKYFLAGLRNDARYRTNVGLVNPTAQQVTATVRAFDESGLPIANGTFSETLQAYQFLQFPIGAKIPNFPADHAFSLEVEIGTGQWVIAYASFIDGGSNDPIFLQAIRESELVSEDYRTIVIPGVGHTGAWRSDVEIFNSNGRGIAVDLAYHDATGAKMGEALSVPIGGGQFLHYADLLKQGIFGSDVPDGLGMLRVTVPAAVTTERFPMAYARTYNDDGSGKTYGQGIAGFAAARPNVSETITGLIPAVRSKAGEYYTNVFVTNVTDTPVDFSIKVLDRTTGAQIREDVAHVEAYQTITFGKYDLGGESASLKIQATGKVWAYASVVDDRTKDPEYVPATPITP